MITVNIEKAKSIGHDIRREKRNEEFKPFDDIIAKQIPGKDAAEAESKRQEIRDRYAVIQNNIDESNDIEAIKSAIGLK